MGEEWIEDHMFEVEEYYGWKMDELDYLHNGAWKDRNGKIINLNKIDEVHLENIAFFAYDHDIINKKQMIRLMKNKRI